MTVPRPELLNPTTSGAFFWLLLAALFVTTRPLAERAPPPFDVATEGRINGRRERQVRNTARYRTHRCTQRLGRGGRSRRPVRNEGCRISLPQVGLGLRTAHLEPGHKAKRGHQHRCWLPCNLPRGRDRTARRGLVHTPQRRRSPEPATTFRHASTRRTPSRLPFGRTRPILQETIRSDRRVSTRCSSRSKAANVVHVRLPRARR